MAPFSFDAFPEINTARLRLRAIHDKDAPLFFDVRRNEAVMQYIDRARPKELSEIFALIQKIRDDYASSNGISWVIATAKEDEFIGTVGFWRIDKPNFRAEIGYLLRPEYQGKGLMKEAIQASLDFAFGPLGLHSVEANVNPLNERSQMLLLKMGFRKEAYFTENYYYDGRFMDSVIFSKLAKWHRP